MTEPDAAQHAPEAGPVDVLILTALQDELEAVLDLGPGGRAGWEESKDQQGFRCYRRRLDNGRGGVLGVAAAWSGEMGAVAAAGRAQQLIGELDPGCLAMCGICAGYRKKVALGDVIVADQLYSYDEGKVVAKRRKPPEVFHSLRTFDLQATWKMDAAFLARELDRSALSRARPRSRAVQRRWVLSALLAQDEAGGGAPAMHADRKSKAPDWTALVGETQRAGLVTLQGGRLALTATGREQALNDQVLHADGLPEDPPFQVHVGAIATGVAVQEDPELFERLCRLVRTTLGVEMEGAAIGGVAARFQRRAIVVKAVSDHADDEKDDSFRKFACRASAEVLLAFLLKHVEVERAADAREEEPGGRDATVRGLREKLGAVHGRKQRLAERGLSTQEVDREILGLRRELRAGGQIHEGDALGSGRYLLVRRIGKGGFAIVWEAIDTSRDERVALKVLHPELARDATRLERFFRGAREMAELMHEAVVRVFDQHGEDDGWHYFVMEYAPGGDLRRAVLEKRVSAGDVLGIIARVGGALAAAHAKGLVHRDVKPANVLLDGAGAPRLTDFDLVAVADTTGGTRTGAMGTFLYAAPEMMDRPQDADARADVYGLGMTAVFAFYGGELPVAMMMTQRERLIDGLSCGEEVKAALKKAVEWEVDARFGSVVAFCEALEAARARSPEGLMAARGRVIDRLAAVGAVPLAPGEVEVMWATSSGCNAVAWSPSGELVVSGHDDGSLRLWDVVTGLGIRVMDGPSGSVWSVAFSPDGLTLASGVEDHKVRLWDVGTGRLLRTFDGYEYRVRSVAFSPDGLTVASVSYNPKVRLWDVGTGWQLRIFEGHHKDRLLSIAFSPYGLTLASGSSDHKVRLWDVGTGRQLRAFEGHAGGVWSVAFSPDGLTLASGSSDSQVGLWDVGTGRQLRAFEGHAGGVWSVAFSPDGLTLASGSSDHTVRLWDVATGRTLRTFEGHTQGVMSVAFSPDGHTLASASLDGTLRLWSVATARCLAILLPLPKGWAAFTPDGRYKLGGDIAGSFWHVIGLSRFEPGELDPYLPHLRIPDDAPLIALPPAPPADP